jgi:hypothetical protein
MMNHYENNTGLIKQLDAKELICFDHHQGLVVGRIAQNILSIQSKSQMFCS